MTPTSEVIRLEREAAARHGHTLKDEPEKETLEFIAELVAMAKAEALAEGWQPIETAPKTGQTLLLGYFNSHGKWRTLRGQWFSREAIDETWEDPDEAEEGWYETPVEIDDTPNCFWTQPTHWRPLPPPPKEAP